jgi:hypothetical protein
MRLTRIIVVISIMAIGVIATAVAVINRSDGDNSFVFQQQNLTPVTPAVLERFVASAPDPRPGTGKHRGLGARCLSQGLGELRNPWVCTVRYPVGPNIRYRVVIDPTGHVSGANADGSLTVYGCCVGYGRSA